MKESSNHQMISKTGRKKEMSVAIQTELDKTAGRVILAKEEEGKCTEDSY